MICDTNGLSIGHTTISLITVLANSRPAMSFQSTGGPWSIIYEKTHIVTKIKPSMNH